MAVPKNDNAPALLNQKNYEALIAWTNASTFYKTDSKFNFHIFFFQSGSEGSLFFIEIY